MLTVQQNTGRAKKHIIILLSLAVLGIFLVARDLPGSATQSTQPDKRIISSSNATDQQISYSTNPQDVLIRTFRGGGLYGSVELSPDLSIYGDGTYIFGVEKQGKLDSNQLQELLRVLTSNYGLLKMHRQQFYDIQDQSATFLELTLNDKTTEFIYGSFGNQQESTQDMAEYNRLDQALRAINEALKGPIKAYSSNSVALLVRRTYSPDLTQEIPTWTLPDFEISQAATFVCGVIPKDETSQNAETSCLKYVIPQNAILLTASQVLAIQEQLNGGKQWTFTEQGLYFTVYLRPLLPDELPLKMLAMFGANETTYRGVPLL